MHDTVILWFGKSMSVKDPERIKKGPYIVIAPKNILVNEYSFFCVCRISLPGVCPRPCIVHNPCSPSAGRSHGTSPAI